MRSLPSVGCRASIEEKDAIFVEALRHATNDAEIVVCDVADKRCYVSQAEWTAGCKVFDVQSESAEIVSSNSSSAEKIALFRSLLLQREAILEKALTILAWMYSSLLLLRPLKAW